MTKCNKPLGWILLPRSSEPNFRSKSHSDTLEIMEKHTKVLATVQVTGIRLFITTPPQGVHDIIEISVANLHIFIPHLINI